MWSPNRLPRYVRLGLVFVGGLFVGGLVYSSTSSPVLAPEIDSATPAQTSIEPADPGPALSLPIISSTQSEVLASELADYVQGRAVSYVIQDVATGQTLVSSDPDRAYFSASLYKLYFAFLAWQDIDSGDLLPIDNFWDGQSTLDCLDLMIRTSDSPCGEAVLALYDQAQATDRLRALGLPNVDAAAFTVSAADMAIMLGMILDQEGISAEASGALLAAMKDQTFDKGLRTSFDIEGWSIYDKVGTSSKDWHDVGIVQRPDDRQVIVSVLSEGIGSSGIRAFGDIVRASLQE